MLIIRPFLILAFALQGQGGADDRDAARLVEQLSSEDVRARERAEEALRKLGERAEGPLKAALDRADAEGRERIKRTLDRIRGDSVPGVLCIVSGESPLRIMAIDPATREASEFFKGTHHTLGDLTWSPVAKKAIVTVTLSGIHAVDGRGDTSRKLTGRRPDSGRSHHWSPDGKRYLYVMEEDLTPGGWVERTGPPRAIVLDVESGKEHDVPPLDREQFDPCWSPDGKKIALVLSEPGEKTTYDIVLASLEDIVLGRKTELQRITRDGKPKSNLSWSPDGKRIAFYWETEKNGLGLLDLETREIEVIGSRDGRGYAPAWSPRSDEIVYLLRIGGEEENQIRIYTLGDKSDRLVVGEPTDKDHVSWSPNGKWLLFQEERDGINQIHMVKRTGQDRVQLTSFREGALEPVWAPGR